MKKFFYPLVGLLALTACSDSNDDPKPDTDPVVESKNLDYSASNAQAWGNYMRQVAQLLQTDATDLYDAWTVSYNGGESFAQRFKKHNSSDYPSAKSCLDQIVEGCADIANEVGTAKIGDPYNLYQAGQKESALYAVESWYSWHSREDYSNNILSIRNSYLGTLDGSEGANSIAALVKEVNPDLDAEVRAAITKAYNSILAIPQPFRSNIVCAQSDAAMTACAELEQTLTNRLKPALAAVSGRDAQLQKIVDNYVDAVVLPTYKQLKDRNEALYNGVVAFVSAPSDAAFQNCANLWLTARQPWETSEAFLFGPVDAMGLDPNMDSWPLDQDAIVQILTSGNFDLDWSDGDSDDAVEAKQSVRGFHTLEFLIFKDGKPRTVK